VAAPLAAAVHHQPLHPRVLPRRSLTPHVLPHSGWHVLLLRSCVRASRLQVQGPLTEVVTTLARDATLWHRGLFATPHAVHAMMAACTTLADRLAALQVYGRMGVRMSERAGLGLALTVTLFVTKQQNLRWLLVATEAEFESVLFTSWCL
jgi:hypothetical protein